LSKSQADTKGKEKTEKATHSEILKGKAILYYTLYYRLLIDKMQASANEIKRWESKHMGGFRRIYPLEDGEKDIYEKFFENTGSLYQTTASTKAREEAVRLQRMEIENKSKPKLPDPGESSRTRYTIFWKF